MNCNGFRFGVFTVLLTLLFSKGTCVFGFIVLRSNPLEAPSNHNCFVSESTSPSTHMKIQSKKQHVFRHETKCRRISSSRLFGERRVKFSNDFKTNNNDDSSSSLANPLDQLLSFLASDAFSIVVGIIGLLAVVVYRWNLVLGADPDRATAEALTYQTRADLLAVFASGSVLLNGVTKLDVTTALAESVVLEGTTLSEPEQLIENDSSSSNTLTWALESILAATPAKTAVLISDIDDRWMIQCRAGVVPSSLSISLPEKTPILERVGSPENSKETYLPTLQALPGRFELSYLPNNAQMAVLIPIQTSNSSKKNSVLVLGGNTAKGFSPRDIAWSRIVAEKIGEDL